MDATNVTSDAKIKTLSFSGSSRESARPITHRPGLWSAVRRVIERGWMLVTSQLARHFAHPSSTHRIDTSLTAEKPRASRLEGAPVKPVPETMASSAAVKPVAPAEAPHSATTAERVPPAPVLVDPTPARDSFGNHPHLRVEQHGQGNRHHNH